jgi:protein phosphatase
MAAVALEVGKVTRLGSGLMPHHLQQRAFVAADRGVVAILRGYGGQATGYVAVTTLDEELNRALAADPAGDATAAVLRAMAAASARLRATPPAAAPRLASVTAAILEQERISLVHIGSNVAYRLRGTTLERLTADHTFDGGFGRYHRRILVHVLGHDDESIERIDRDAAPGDRLILANDTVLRALNEDELRERGSVADVQAAAESLVALAHERIGDDSATAVVTLIR